MDFEILTTFYTSCGVYYSIKCVVVTVNDFSLLFIILMKIAVNNNDETDLKTEGGRSAII